MNICVHGIDFRNYGALMMLDAVRRAAAQRFRRATVAVPFTSGTAAARRHAEVHTALLTRQHLPHGLPLGGRISSHVGALLTRHWRSRHGWLLDKELDVHVDASGYAYADCWGPGPARRMALLAKGWSARGTPLILLPQAYGPFDDRRTAAACAQYFEHARLIFARDEASFDALQGLRLQRPQIALAPDFTEPASAVDGAAQGAGAIVVPNSRCLDTARLGSTYLSTLTATVAALRAAGYRPAVLAFEVGDRHLAADLAGVAGCPLVQESGWRNAVAILREQALVVSSRFHALIASLNAGVPAMAIGWGHKYHWLMAEYGMAHWNFSSDEADAVRECILASPSQLGALRTSLAAQQQRLAGRRQQMWSAAWQLLEGREAAA